MSTSHPDPDHGAPPLKFDSDPTTVYMAATWTPSAGAPPAISALPPIAASRPVPPLDAGVRHIPLVMGPPPGPLRPEDQELPAAVPVPPPVFECMDQCRFLAGFMLCYYVCTLFFFQPLFVGTLGILTGFLGYYGSRPPIVLAHVTWIRRYRWMNGAMMVFNVLYLVLALILLGTWARRYNEENDTTHSYAYNEQHLDLVIGFVVTMNFALHFRALSTARAFYAELQRAGSLPLPPAQSRTS